MTTWNHTPTNDTPILESVFTDLADDAEDFDTILTVWPLLALSYTELADWTEEIAEGQSTIYDHAGLGIGILR